MAFPESSPVKQPAVLWIATGSDENGTDILADPVEITVRLEQEATELLDPAAGPVSGIANVSVNQVIPMNSRLCLGTIATLPLGLDPLTLAQAVDVTAIPDLKARQYQRTVVFRGQEQTD